MLYICCVWYYFSAECASHNFAKVINIWCSWQKGGLFFGQLCVSCLARLGLVGSRLLASVVGWVGFTKWTHVFHDHHHHHRFRPVKILVQQSPDVSPEEIWHYGEHVREINGVLIDHNIPYSVAIFYLCKMVQCYFRLFTGQKTIEQHQSTRR